MLKRMKVFGVAAAATFLMAASAHAATVIDFRTGRAGEGGNIVQVGDDFVGTDIPIGVVTISGAPTESSNGVWNVYGPAGSSVEGNFGDLDFNTSDADNYITILGCIPDLSLGDEACEDPYLLVTGTITTAVSAGAVIPGATGVFLGGDDTKHAALLAAVGLPADTPFAVFGSSFTTGPLSGDGSPVVSTDLVNTSAIPEPATMVLLGTGLLAAFRARRRQA